MQADINARGLDNSTLALFRDNVACRVIEPRANTYVLLGLHATMQTRGWMDFERGFELIRSTAARMERLQHILLYMIRCAADCTDAREFAALAKPMEETMMAALDSILVENEATRPRPRSFDHHRKLVARLDELIHESPAVPLYSDELARGVGASVRTLQTATQAVHGMSLHQYHAAEAAVVDVLPIDERTAASGGEGGGAGQWLLAHGRVCKALQGNVRRAADPDHGARRATQCRRRSSRRCLCRPLRALRSLRVGMGAARNP
jgi:hypothetical protein